MKCTQNWVNILRWRAAEVHRVYGRAPAVKPIIGAKFTSCSATRWIIAWKKFLPESPLRSKRVKSGKRCTSREAHETAAYSNLRKFGKCGADVVAVRHNWSRMAPEIDKKCNLLLENTNEWNHQSDTYLMKYGKKWCYTENNVPLVVQSFVDWLFQLCYTYVSNIAIVGLCGILQRVQQQYEWEYEWARTRRPVAWLSQTISEKPWIWRTASYYGETRCIFLARMEHVPRHREAPTVLLVSQWGRRCLELKYSHLLPEWPEVRDAGGPELLRLYARDAQVKPYLKKQKLGIDTSWAQGLNWDLFQSQLRLAKTRS